MAPPHGDRLITLILLSACLLLGVAISAQARQVEQGQLHFNFIGEPLSDALEEIARLTRKDLIYDPALVANIHVYLRITSSDIDTLLRETLSGSGLDFIVLSSGTYVIVESTMVATPYGSLSGKVMDANTGFPLPNAHVLFADASGGTSTSQAGHFNLQRLEPGRQRMIVSYVGYEPLSIEIEIPPGSTVTEEIRMRPKPLESTPVIVSAHQPVLPSGGRGGAVTTLSEWLSGSRTADPVQHLSLFSGVQYGLPMTGLHLQGGDRGDHRFYLDGMPVYSPYSFGRLYSAFSPYALDRITVEKAGFGVASGSHIAGRIDASHDVANRRNNRSLFQIDPLFTNVRADFASSGEEYSRFHLMTAFRSTFWDRYRSGTLSGTLADWELIDPLTYGVLQGVAPDEHLFTTMATGSDVQYHDIHLAGRYEIDLYRALSFSLYHGENRFGSDLLARDVRSTQRKEVFSSEKWNSNNLMFQAAFDWLASPRLDASLQIGFSGSRLEHNYTLLPDETVRTTAPEQTDTRRLPLLTREARLSEAQRNRNRIGHFSARTDIRYVFSPRFRLESGLQVETVDSDLQVSDRFYLETHSRQESVHHGTWLDAVWQLPGDLQLRTGSRATLLTPSGTLYPEPRASLQLERTETAIGYWSIKLSGGLYRQFVNQFEITNPGPGSLIPNFTIWSHDSRSRQPKAWHAAISFLSEPGPLTTIRVETYLRQQTAAWITSYQNLMVDTTIDRFDLDSFAEQTRRTAYGAGITIHHLLHGGRLRLLAGYDYSVSRVDMERQFGRTLPAPWNEPHRVQARMIVRLHPDWTIVSGWQGIYGRSWAFRDSYYNFMLPHRFSSIGGFNFENPESDRLPAYHQLDLSLIYRRTLGLAGMETRLNLTNLMNRKNVLDWTLRPGPGNELEIVERTLPGFHPSMSLKIGF